DVSRALASRGYASDGDLTIACGEAISRERVHLSVRCGNGEVRPVDAPPDLELARSTLASIVSAGLRPLDAAEPGLLRGAEAALATAERMFSGPRFQCLDPF